MATKISYGWIKRGHDKLIPTTASRTRENIVGLINLKTMDIVIETHETVNGDAMIRSMKKTKTICSDVPCMHVILDQGPANKSKAVKRVCRLNVCGRS